MANLEPVAEDCESGKMSTENCTSTLKQSCTPAGDKSAVPCLIPSFADACKLVDAPYSCLVVESHRRHVALSPLYLRKKRSGIQEQLNAELLKYSESLKGVPLAYDNIKVIGQYGDIYDDNGFIHMNIEAMFVIFQPKRGQNLSGVINKVGVSHVGCVVHGCFNASVPRPPQVSQEVWQQAGLSVGSALEFQVSQLDADTAGVLLIRGRLNRHSTQTLAAVGVANGAELTEEPPEETTAKKKKKHKNPANDSAGVSTATDETTAGEFVAVETDAGTALVDVDVNMNGHGDGKKKKKKKKKRKEEEEAQEEVQQELQQNSPVEFHISDSRGYQSDKGSRKRKKREEQEEGVELSNSLEESEPKKKKQKKNKRSSQ
ncbi:hypothetical protein ANANG_G00184940 [Anguilla anguilla]|uniref:DNA-directed RNA polymerase subunit n=1 Tax=Anguilla anguilla TaxID=7936 RepID=A0A9D3RU25_ANGAN|nr:hypothetical protein ANANG_G00184940 [Anguilla anguilla]